MRDVVLTGAWIYWLVAGCVILTVAVLVHELAHVVVARWCGINVDVVSLGIGSELFGFTDRRQTRWKVSILPIGGYARLQGEEINGKAVNALLAIAMLFLFLARQIPPGKSVTRRCAVLIAGPVASFLMAIAFLVAYFTLSGNQEIIPRVSEVLPQSAAAAAGFMPGDVVESIDGRRVESFADIQRIVAASPEKPLIFTIARSGRQLELRPTLGAVEIAGPLGRSRAGVLGIKQVGGPDNVVTLQVGPATAVALAAGATWQVTADDLAYFGHLVTGRIEPTVLSSVVAIVEPSRPAPSVMALLLYVLAAASVSVGLTNLLPIPLLDGGELVLCVVEATRGRPLSVRARKISGAVGIAVIAVMLILMLILTGAAVYHDI
jgi:regulator of sigma E protease